MGAKAPAPAAPSGGDPQSSQSSAPSGGEGTSQPAESKAASGGPSASGEVSTKGKSDAAPSGEATTSVGGGTTSEPFDWVKWDRKVESLPDPLRPHGEGLLNQFNEWNERVRAAEDYRNLYTSLIETGEDPRVNQYKTEAQKYQEDLKRIQSESEQLKTQMNEYVKQQAEEDTKRFKEKNADIFEDHKSLELFKQLLTDKSGLWDDWEVMAELARLPDELFASAVGARKSGASEQWALKWAKQQAVRPPPPAAAAIMAGATPTPTPTTIDKKSNSVKTLEERRRAAVERAMRKS